MRFSAFKKLFLRDYSDAPKGEWLQKLLENLNLFIDQSTTAFRNNLTFEENFRGIVKSAKFSSNVELDIPAERVNGVILLSAAEGAIVSGFGYRPKNNGNIGVTIIHNKSEPIECKMLILL